MDDQDQRLAGETRDRSDIAQDVKTQIGEEGGIDRVGRTDQQQRVAIRRRAHDHLGRRVARCAGQILNHERLAEPIGQPFAYEAGEDVVRTTSNKSDHEPHRPRRVGLRLR